jgi:hypothetical protein
MTKAFTMVVLLVAGLSVSACWESEEDKANRRASEFMKDFGKCADCDLKKPLLGSHNFGKDAGR